MERANLACDSISQIAWEHQVFGQFKLHHLVYKEVKERFGLSAQMVVRCISKVADAYKLDRKKQRTFKMLGSIAYDDRILTYEFAKNSVSIWATEGRLQIPFTCGEHQNELLQTRQGESDLCLVKDKWFLLVTCNVEEPPTDSQCGIIGCDFIQHNATNNP